MNSPEYMLIDLAVGGYWPGSPDAATNWALANMKVDYVRAYSLTPTANSAPTVSLSNALDPASATSSFTVPSPWSQHLYDLIPQANSGSVDRPDHLRDRRRQCQR